MAGLVRLVLAMGTIAAVIIFGPVLALLALLASFGARPGLDTETWPTRAYGALAAANSVVGVVPDVVAVATLVGMGGYIALGFVAALVGGASVAALLGMLILLALIAALITGTP